MTPDEKILRDPNMTDAEKARRTQRSIHAVRYARYKLGIPVHHKPPMQQISVRLKPENLAWLRKQDGGIGAAINGCVELVRRRHEA